MKSIISKIIPILFVCFSLSASAQSETKVTNIDPATLATALNNKSIQLIDVRTPNEFKSGHLKKSVNINYYDQDFSKQVMILDKDKPIYVYCRSGVRSKYASDILKKLGFKTIYNLNGGVLNWTSHKLPLIK